MRNLLQRRVDQNLFRHGQGLSCAFSHNIYGAYCVPVSSSHRPAARKILANRIYEPDTIDYLAKTCGDGDIVHAGTFFGDFLPALSKSVSKSARVWAFEPNPENFRCAQITAFLNNLQNVELHNLALGACTEAVKFMIEDECGRALGGASRVVEKQADYSEGAVVEIEVTTIDLVVPAERKISIIQLDVEGHEIPALKGAVKAIAQWRLALILEVLRGTTLEDDPWFRANIVAMGYKLERKLHGNLVFKADKAELEILPSRVR